MSRRLSFLRKTLTITASIAIALAATACGGGASTGPGPSTGGDTAGSSGGDLMGKAAPEISATAVTGDGPATIAEAKGRVTIVDFWATFCEPCKKSFPKYQELMDKFGGDLVVIAVSVDNPEDVKEDALKEFAKTTNVKFKIVWDKDQSTVKKYNPPKMPTSFILDKDGNVKHIHAGYESGEESKIGDEVQALLGK